jgi:malto-oligosyltrehalose synthase/4-alpha-glucanotransferase
MLDPISTYRIQFHAGFTFADFRQIIPYLVSLGIRTVYASPVFEAVPGSTHGYDGINPHRINPEIGTEEELREISNILRSHGLSWIQDIVPNHMAFDHRNEWLMDVLETGTQSRYAGFFDLVPGNPAHDGRIMVPFLGKPLDQTLEAGELSIDVVNERLSFRYYDAAYPLHPRSYSSVLSEADDAPDEMLPGLLREIEDLMQIDDASAWREGWAAWKERLASGLRMPAGRAWMENRLTALNADRSALAEIAGQQEYRLCHWQETDTRINYRRFFTVNGLICLNIHEPFVFDEYHRYIHTLVRDGVFQGLRIDHIDGLYDPTAYLRHLRDLVGENIYLIAEKILEADESLPAYWPLQGNTGYDVLALVNNLLTNRAACKPFTQYYLGLARDYRTVPQRVRDSKAHILYNQMEGELDNLCRLFYELELADTDRLNALSSDVLRRAIGAFLIHCPVYRFYSAILPLMGEEAKAVADIVATIRQTEPELASALDLLEEAWLTRPIEGDDGYTIRAVHFFKRCGQFSGPIMAKGVEDTLMYSYNRFIGHNEVGDAVDAFGISTTDFHKRMKERQEAWPLSLNASSTHDTKRGEDVRARLNVLTDLGEAWLTEVKRWMSLPTATPAGESPDANDRYFIYQTIIGASPMPGDDTTEFTQRMTEYLVKAMREAKRHSNWTTPNESYEQAVVSFTTALLQPGSEFRENSRDFFRRVADHGIVNSLVQVALKFTLPGVPDVYQGCEGWDLSLVDPDNRRPVDYEKRKQWLAAFNEATDINALIEDLWQDRFSGRIKAWLVRRLFQLRASRPALFLHGDYIPLNAAGHLKEYVFAFARQHGTSCLVVILPLHLASLVHDADTAVDWKDTHVTLPPGLAPYWKNSLQETSGHTDGTIPISGLFATLPLAILELEAIENRRSAGILAHITSLPSPYGVGDLGPEATAFAQFLQSSRQRYWQLLPINPTEAGQGHSPYSATSSRAGNTLLISPDLLAAEGWLQPDDLTASVLPRESLVPYDDAERVKKVLLQKAWLTYSSGSLGDDGFESFCRQEESWLTDFARYRVLKEIHGGQPWYQWPAPLKSRDAATLVAFDEEHSTDIRREKWWQYQFHRQWMALKANCNDKGIRLIGDLPFYISYDSADVWASQELFKLDANGERLGMAGVPPDSFSADGQLWGMPVFRWDVLRETGYAWWIERLRKNREFFDLIRLDHFRAFAAYWEVPAGAATARDGSWQAGPGADFLAAVRDALGEMPFIAEDLGEIDDDVRKLRDDFALPGMKILQFAFGEDLATSEYIPHNYGPNFIAYSGTHDNNTTRGWYRQEADAGIRHRLNLYTGQEVTDENSPFVLARLAYASVAKTVILPVQDLLGLDESARMNTPASAENNWAWRLTLGQLGADSSRLLKEWTRIFNRR